MNNDILYSVEKNIALITFNRPDRRNSINKNLLYGLFESLEKAQNDNNVKVVVITGNGKSFCSGVDLDALKTDNLFEQRPDGKDMLDFFEYCKKPIIGAVNGHAITGGYEIALNCDFLIASENASFADTHSRVGIHPGWGITQLLQQAVGQRMAKQLSLTCQFIDAQTALRIGLVNEVVPADQLMTRVMQVAGFICEGKYDMLMRVKGLIEYRNNSTFEGAMKNERTSFLTWLQGVAQAATKK